MGKNISDAQLKEYQAEIDSINYDEEYLERLWSKKEQIRAYDNSKFGVGDWFGRKDYADLTDAEVDKRLAEITIEKAQHHG